MADGVTLAGKTFATDQVTVEGQLVDVPRDKMGFGAAGAYSDVSASTPLPVDVSALVTLLTSLLTELQQKLEPGGVVALDSASLAALESITAVVSGPVALDSATLAALETIQIGSSALPTGAATETTLAAARTSADALAAATGTQADAASASSIIGRLKAIANAVTTTAANFLAVRLTDGTSYLQSTNGRLQVADGGTALKTDGSAATQPVSGSVAVSNLPATQPVSAAALPLPAGAATETTIATATGRLAVGAPTDLPGSNGQVGTGTVLLGYTARETAGATAVFRLRKGNATTGAILATVSLGANESARDWYGPSGIDATGGIYFQLVSGTVEGGVQAR